MKSVKLNSKQLRSLIKEAIQLDEMTSVVGDETSKIIGGVLMANRDSIARQLSNTNIERPVRIEDIDDFAEHASREITASLQSTITALLKSAYRKMM
jgi:hypothetical protein